MRITGEGETWCKQGWRGKVIRWREALVRTANETNASLVGNGVIGSWIPFHGNTVSLFLTRFVPANVRSMSNRNSGNAVEFRMSWTETARFEMYSLIVMDGGGPFHPVCWVSKFLLEIHAHFGWIWNSPWRKIKSNWTAVKFFKKRKGRLEWWCKIVRGGGNYFIVYLAVSQYKPEIEKFLKNYNKEPHRIIIR